MAAIERVDRALAAVEQAVIIAVFAALILAAAAAVVARNLLHIPHQPLLEAIPTLVLWLSLAGSLAAIRAQRHIRMELMRSVTGPLRRVIYRLVQLFAAAVTALLLAASVTFVRGEVALFGPGGWLLAAFPLFFGLATVRFVLLALHGKPAVREAK